MNARILGFAVKSASTWKEGINVNVAVAIKWIWLLECAKQLVSSLPFSVLEINSFGTGATPAVPGWGRFWISFNLVSVLAVAQTALMGELRLHVDRERFLWVLDLDLLRHHDNLLELGVGSIVNAGVGDTPFVWQIPEGSVEELLESMVPEIQSTTGFSTSSVLFFHLHETTGWDGQGVVAVSSAWMTHAYLLVVIWSELQWNSLVIAWHRWGQAS